MLVQLVNFEKCHSPLRLWLSPAGTVSPIMRGQWAHLLELSGESRCEVFWLPESDWIQMVKQDQNIVRCLVVS
jgi:hypothetical protein